MVIGQILKSTLSLEMIQGSRTYLVGIMMILQAVAGIYTGETSGIELLADENLFEGLFGAGLMSLRKSIDNE